jgi:septum formation protein
MITVKEPIILASQSPRRKQLLESMGVACEVCPSNFDEDSVQETSPMHLVQTLAGLKAEVIASEFPNRWVLAADTLVALGNEIFGKPRDKAHSEEMLARLSGRAHSVWGGIALMNKQAGVLEVASSHTEVIFNPIAPKQLEDYVLTGEGMDKAGSYGVQGPAAAFVSRIVGSYTNVVGLDLALVLEMLTGHGMLV